VKGTEQRPLPPSFWAPARKSSRAFTVATIGLVMGVLYVCLAALSARWRPEWPIGLVYLVISAIAAVVRLALRRRERRLGGAKRT
jgi:hypothetical protein